MQPAARITASGWTFTNHLHRRALERGISGSQITAVLDDPEITYAQTNYGPNRQVRQRGELSVVVDLATRTVITVVFRSHDRWLQQLASAAVAA
jgi:Domain of unknown function (DUF4258)